jgi:hypothetical protein
MTTDEQKIYIRAQLATIARDEAEAREQIAALQSRLVGLAYARRAYHDMLTELDKPGLPAELLPMEAVYGLDDAKHLD